MKLEAKQRLRAMKSMTSYEVAGFNDMLPDIKKQADRLYKLPKEPSDLDRMVLGTEIDSLLSAVTKAKYLLYGKK